MPEIIVALDLPSGEAALNLVDRIGGLRWVKVGSVLFVREGPGLIGDLKERGLNVFLDLKWHDIPNTVAGAVRHAQELGVDMGSLHALGGAEMMRRAAAEKGSMSLVAVTVLTSHDAPGIGDALGRVTAVADEVGRLAALAVSAGADGVVCSAEELALVRGIVGEASPIVVPGIRNSGDAADDQSRVATPASAAAGGATHLVVGRPVLRAADPGAAFTSLVAAVS